MSVAVAVAHRAHELCSGKPLEYQDLAGNLKLGEVGPLPAFIKLNLSCLFLYLKPEMCITYLKVICGQIAVNLPASVGI
jgi:hypothetical protein